MKKSPIVKLMRGIAKRSKRHKPLNWWDEDFTPSDIKIIKGCKSKYYRVVVDTGKKIRISNRHLKRFNPKSITMMPRSGHTYKLVPTKAKNLFRLILFADVCHNAPKKGEIMMVIGEPLEGEKR